jgi:hypothetical protein
MHYPFVAVRDGVPHWPRQALFVTTPALASSTAANPAREFVKTARKRQVDANET